MARIESEPSISVPKQQLAVRHGIGTDVGQVRSENQDSFGYAATRYTRLFVVADGMGGSGGGATASTIAVNVFCRRAITEGGTVTRDSMREAIYSCHDAILETSTSDPGLNKMGTTVVALALVGDVAVIGHVGDSRLYLIKNGNIFQMTRDHTLVQELVDSGTISRDDAEHHPMSHYLTKSLSPESNPQAEVHVYPEKIEAGDKFLLCCDGLYNMVTEGEMAQVITSREPAAAAKILINLANERGGTDNITVEVIEVQGIAEEPIPLGEGEMELVLSADYRTAEISEFAKEVIERTISPTRPSPNREDAVELENEVFTAGHQHTQESAGTESAKEPQSKTPPNKPASGGSAFEGLIFGSTGPSQKEIEEELKSFEETQKQEMEEAISKIGGAKSASNDTAKDKVSEPDPHSDEHLEKEGFNSSDQRFAVVTQVISIVLLVAVVFFGYVLLSKYRTTSGEVQLASISTAPSEPPTPFVPPAPVESVAAESVGVQALEEAKKTFAAVDRVLESGSNLQAPTEEIANVPPSKSEAPSEVSPSAQQAEQTLPQPPVDQDIQLLSEVMASASDTFVSSVPGGMVNVPVEPKAEITPPDMASKVVERKLQLREEISDLDLQLRLLQDTKALENENSQLVEQKARVEKSLPAAERRLADAKRRVEIWQARRETLQSLTPDKLTKLANEVAVTSALVGQKKEAYEIAVLRHLEAVELWNENPSDNAAASKMSQLTKELRAREAHLEQAVRTGVTTAIEQAQFDYADWGVSLEDLKRRKTRLARQQELIKSFAAKVAKGNRVDLQRELFDSRVKLKGELDFAAREVSDTRETELRKSAALH